MSHSPSAQAGGSDALFQIRLDEINKEMAVIMDQNVAKKNELREEGQYAPPPFASSSKYAPLISTSSDVVQREVQGAVDREMRRVQDHVKDMVNREWENRAAELDQLLRSRFTELKGSNDHVGKIVLEIANDLQVVRKESRDQIEELKDSIDNKLSELKRDQANKERSMRREIHDLKLQVEELSQNNRDDNCEFKSRMETMLKKAAEKMLKTTSFCEEQVSTCREELQEMVRNTSKKHTQQFDELERHLMQLHADTEMSEKTLKKVHRQVNEILEEHGVNKSELRGLRSDTDRLEMLLQSKLDRFPGAQLMGGNVEDQLKVQQDLYALKQSVAYLGEVVENNSTSSLPSPAKAAAKGNAPGTYRNQFSSSNTKKVGAGAKQQTASSSSNTKKASPLYNTALYGNNYANYKEEEASEGSSNNFHVDPTNQVEDEERLEKENFGVGVVEEEQNSYVDSKENSGPRDWGTDTDEEEQQENSKLANSALD